MGKSRSALAVAAVTVRSQRENAVFCENWDQLPDAKTPSFGGK
jgi:hypothetical protein